MTESSKGGGRCKPPKILKCKVHLPGSDHTSLDAIVRNLDLSPGRWGATLHFPRERGQMSSHFRKLAVTLLEHSRGKQRWRTITCSNSPAIVQAGAEMGKRAQSSKGREREERLIWEGNVFKVKWGITETEELTMFPKLLL